MYSHENILDMANIPINDMQPTGLPQVSQFNLDVGKSSQGNVIAYSSLSNGGNVYLYDVAPLSILLCLPPGIDPKFSPSENIKLSPKAFTTIHGEKNGYVFYKNNATHVTKLDIIFPGSNWREKLSSSLPEPKESKVPVFMTRANILHNGENVPASLYEYSDKQLVVFAARDLAGDKNILSYWQRFVCPEAPSGYSEGYSAWKNNPRAINFLRQIFNFNDLESKYVKSQPKTSVPIQVQGKPNVIFENKQIAYGTNTYLMDVIETSPLAICIFFNPPLGLSGFENNWKNDLNHPTKGKIGGFMLPKSRTDMIGWIEQTFQLDKFEGFYLLTDEPSARATAIISQPGSMSAGPDNSNIMSNMGISSLADIPVSTLLRLLVDKIKSTTTFINKSDVGGKLLLMGDASEVLDNAANNDDMATEIDVIYEGKRAILLKPNP